MVPLERVLYGQAIGYLGRGGRLSEPAGGMTAASLIRSETTADLGSPAAAGPADPGGQGAFVPGLDGLRGVAVLAVMAFHAGVPGPGADSSVWTCSSSCPVTRHVATRRRTRSYRHDPAAPILGQKGPSSAAGIVPRRWAPSVRQGAGESTGIHHSNCVATPSSTCSTSRTGITSRLVRITSSASARPPRCSTPGPSPWRSSSTGYGR